MSDRQIIVTAFVGAPLIAILALAIIFRESWMPRQPAAQMPPPVVRQEAPRVALSVPATQPATTRPSQPESGAKALSRMWAESLPRQQAQTTPVIAASPATKPTAEKAPAQAGPPSVEAFERFAEAFVKEFGSDREVEFREGQKDQKNREIGYGMSLVSTDILKTDSVAHPVVGVVKMQETKWMKNTDSIYFFSSGLSFEMHFAPLAGGKWKPVKVKLRVTDENVVPAELMANKRTRIGDESEWNAKAVQKYADAVQK